jgi:hypothetical protein
MVEFIEPRISVARIDIYEIKNENLHLFLRLEVIYL